MRRLKQSASTSSSASQGYSSLLGSGWSVVKSSAGTTGTAHYANAANGGVAQSSSAAGYKPLPVNDLNISARYWLVGALNTLVQALPSGATVGVGNDYVKIAGVGGDVPKLVKLATSGRPILALDGCPLECVRNSLQRHAITPTRHYQLHKYGVKKRNHQDFDPEQAAAVLEHIQADLHAHPLPEQPPLATAHV